VGFCTASENRYLRGRLPSHALILVVCLLAVGALSVPVATAHLDTSETAATQPTEEGPSYASPADDSVTGEGYETASLNLGAAVQSDAQALRTEHDRRVFDSQLGGSGTGSARDLVADRRYEILVSRYERLDEREDELTDAYGSGELDDGLFLTELVNLQTALQSQVSLREQARTESSMSVPERLWKSKGRSQSIRRSSNGSRRHSALSVTAIRSTSWVVRKRSRSRPSTTSGSSARRQFGRGGI